ATGATPLSYQWQENDGGGWLDLSEGGVYSNTSTATMNISDVTGLDGYQYRCVVTNPCGSATSNAATLTVNPLVYVPRIMNYQAKLTDENGVAIHDADRVIAFMIYDAETGGSPIWAETLSTNCVNGLFDVCLGEVHPIDLPFDEQYWIELKVDIDDDGSVEGAADEYFFPREKFASLPYSFRSIYADTAIYSTTGASQVQTVTASDNISTTSTSYVDVPGMSIDITTGNNPVLIMFDASLVHSSTAGQYYQVAIVVDGVVKCAHIMENDGNSREAPYSIHWLETLSEGAHTIKVQWKVTDGTLYHWGSSDRIRKLSVIELK
ncbi:hypothetical protein DRQ33_07805, partial [bacterium]